MHSVASELRGEQNKESSSRHDSSRRESEAAKTMQALHRKRQGQRPGSSKGRMSSAKVVPKAPANDGVADGDTTSDRGKTPDRGKGRARRRSGARPAAFGGVAPKDATARAEMKPTVAPTAGGSSNFNVCLSSLGGSSHETPSGTRIEPKDATARAETGGKKPVVTKPTIASPVGASPLSILAPTSTTTNFEFSSIGSPSGSPSGTPVTDRYVGKQSAEERERLARERSALRQVGSKIDTGRRR